MGADTFSCVMGGFSAQEAFKAAVDDACYEHGHGGYTGTIAEKGNFVTITPTKGEIAKVTEKLVSDAEATVKRCEGIVKSINDAISAGKTEIPHPNGYNTISVKNLHHHVHDLQNAQEKLARYKSGNVSMEHIAQEIADHLIEKGDGRIDDKWGPAGCITVKEPVKTGFKRMTEGGLLERVQKKLNDPSLKIEVQKNGSKISVSIYKESQSAPASFSRWGSTGGGTVKSSVKYAQGKTLAECANQILSEAGEYLFFGWASS